MQRKFWAEVPFKLTLIGKDGEVKFRGESPADLSDIFSVIDAMPMRQREIRERSK